MRNLESNEIQSVNGGMGTLAALAFGATMLGSGFSIGSAFGYYYGFSSCSGNLLGGGLPSIGGFTNPIGPVDNTNLVRDLINTPGFPNNLPPMDFGGFRIA